MRSENSTPDDDLTMESPDVKTEDKLVAQLAAELAAPLPTDPAPESESDAAVSPVEDPQMSAGRSSEPVISPERLAMRQLQGRIRKNLLLKRPVRSSEAEDEDTAPAQPESLVEVGTPKEESAALAEEMTAAAPPLPDPETEPAPVPGPSVTTTEISLRAPSDSETDLSAPQEIDLVTTSEPVDLKTEERPSETIAPLPEVPGTPTRQVVRIEKSSEVFTQLHTAIEYAVNNPNFQTGGLTDASLFQSKHPIVLGVTSAIEGEGKTTVALHLAMDIARNNFKKVCLMDMSLGEDTLSRRLEINTSAGLVHVLEGTHHTLPTIEASEYEGLSIIPAGKTPENPARAARSPALPEILNAARKTFDVILLDMPAITSGNVLPIAPYVDAMVMVVYAGVTPKEVVSDALERLDKSKVLGLVLNRVTTKMPSWLHNRLNRW